MQDSSPMLQPAFPLPPLPQRGRGLSLSLSACTYISLSNFLNVYLASFLIGAFSLLTFFFFCGDFRAPWATLMIVMSWSGKMSSKWVQLPTLSLFHINREYLTRLFVCQFVVYLWWGWFFFLTKMVLEFEVSGFMFDLQYRAAGLAFRLGWYFFYCLLNLLYCSNGFIGYFFFVAGCSGMF